MADDFDNDDEDSFDLPKKGFLKNMFKKDAKEDKKQESKQEQPKPAESGKDEKVEPKLQKKSGDEDSEYDDISIDFSNVFKKKEEKATVKEKAKKESGAKKDLIEPEDEDDDISFNFSKKKEGSEKKEKKEKGKEEEESEGIDMKGVSDSMKKSYDYVVKSVWIIPLLLIIVAISFGTYIRLETDRLSITDDWADKSIDSSISQKVKQDINAEYPNLPDDKKNELIAKEVQKVKVQYKDDIAKTRKDISAQYKSEFKKDIFDANGNKLGETTYLVGIDPYFWMLYVQNILDHGQPGDSLKDGKPYDNHMFAPIGRFVPPDTFHPYLMAYTFSFLTIFNKNLDLTQFMFFVPIFLCALAVIPAFFIAKRLGGNFAGFIAAFMVAVHPFIVARTIGGFADTDPYNLIFPLFIAWFFLIALENKDLKKKIIFSALAGITAGVYSFAWSGWWYIVLILGGVIAVYLVYLIIMNFNKISKDISWFKKEKDFVNTFIVILIFLVITGILATIITGNNALFTVISGPKNIVVLKDVGTNSIWPNVFTTVAEMNATTISDIINNVGGMPFFLIAILGIILAAFKKDEKGDYDIKYSALLIIWFAATIYASTKGIRFVILLLPAFAIAFGLALGIIFVYLSDYLVKELKVNKILAKTILIVLLCLLLISPFQTSMASAKNNIDSTLNDAWYNSLIKIKESSKEDAIITSWWDYGHWFKQVADRPVTFDGTSQNGNTAYWVGKSLLTSDENVTVGIVRMLDCGNNNAFIELDKVINKPYKTIEILNQIILLDKEQAREKLKSYGLDDSQIENVLKNTHCDPPEAFFITSDDMVAKSGVWGHFGSWDFRKATIFNKVHNANQDESIKYMIDEFNYTESQAEAMYAQIQSLGVGQEANNWIAPWPGYANNPSICSKSSKEIYLCPVSGTVAEINVSDMSSSVQTNSGKKSLDSVVFINKTGVFERKSNANIGIGMVLIPVENGYASVAASKEQAESMFTRLYFLEGHNTKHFQKISEESNVIGNRIIVWKIDWEGKQNNVFPLFQVNETINQTSTPNNINESINKTSGINKTLINKGLNSSASA